MEKRFVFSPGSHILRFVKASQRLQPLPLPWLLRFVDSYRSRFSRQLRESRPRPRLVGHLHIQRVSESELSLQLEYKYERDNAQQEEVLTYI
jgi:hypothetical protein